MRPVILYFDNETKYKNVFSFFLKSFTFYFKKVNAEPYTFLGVYTEASTEETKDIKLLG